MFKQEKKNYDKLGLMKIQVKVAGKVEKQCHIHKYLYTNGYVFKSILKILKWALKCNLALI